MVVVYDESRRSFGLTTVFLRSILFDEPVRCVRQFDRQNSKPAATAGRDSCLVVSNGSVRDRHTHLLS
jgi:hypothetical protein